MTIIIKHSTEGIHVRMATIIYRVFILILGPTPQWSN